jgi:putative addiction module component (TIGR02574 family)
MDDRVDRLLRKALGLSVDERARLAAELLASLEPDVPVGQSEEDDWVQEIERRAQAAMAGSPGMSWSEARAWIQARISNP